ncbi:MAG: DinB family protein [Tepidiformaceae bacterium]
MNHPVAEMLKYNRWATMTLLEACRPLTEEQLNFRMAKASGPVRELLVHLVGAQQTQVLRTNGRQHEGELSRTSRWPGFPALLEAATTSADALVAIAEQLQVDSDVDLPFMGKIYRYPTSFFLVHAVAHGVEHRTEIALSLAHQGFQTPNLDGWEYGAAAGYGTEV